MSDQIFDRVKNIIVDKLGVDADKVTPEARFVDELGADSIEIVDVVMSFEEEFGCEIDDEASQKIQTVQDAMDFLADNATK